MNSELRPDFEQAMGESFGDHLCPPVRFEDASAHECCEVLWRSVGRDVTPAKLASLENEQISELSKMFGRYFESEPPTTEQIRAAITATLRRWPVGALGESC